MIRRRIESQMIPMKRHSKSFLALVVLSLTSLHLIFIYSIMETRGRGIGGENEELLDLAAQISSSSRNIGLEEKQVNTTIHVSNDDDDDHVHETAVDKRKIVEEESAANHFSTNESQETAVIIPTHLVPSHPSLDLLLNTFHSIRQYIVGLHPKAPIIITVDNLLEDSPKNRGENGLLLLLNEENRHKLELYLRALYKHFAHEENVKIVVAGKGIGLAENIKKAMDILHPRQSSCTLYNRIYPL
jgi:hypothetical protein